MATYLFVVPSTKAFGELVLGLRLAEELRNRGDSVVFLASAANDILFRGTGFAYEPIDAQLRQLEQFLVASIAKYACDAVVVVDLLVMAFTYTSLRIDLARLDSLPVPVYAMDIWDLRRAPLRVDLGVGELMLPENVRHVVPRRLVPVPFAGLDADGAYSALPASDPAPPFTRSELGLGTDERLVVFATSLFQSSATTAAQARVLASVPRHIVDLCLRSDQRTCVIHVGPVPIECNDHRYHFRTQMARPEYERLVAGADLMVTMNQSATSITTALALGTPALVGTSQVSRDTSKIAPFPFRVFPFGFHDFLSSLLDKNPYAEVVADADIVPGEAFVDAVRTLLFDEAARATSLVRIRDYVEKVRQLPSAVERLDQLR